MDGGCARRAGRRDTGWGDNRGVGGQGRLVHATDGGMTGEKMGANTEVCETWVFVVLLGLGEG